MMSTSHLYENFALGRDADTKDSLLSQEDIEDGKLESFEAGYSSGWEDALKAYADGNVALSEALRDSLRMATLVKQEAFDAFLTSSQTLIEGIVTQVLPAMSQETLGQHIRDIISKSIAETSERSIIIKVSAVDYDSLVRISAEWLPDDAELRSDATLSPGQADLSLDSSETHIDLKSVIADVNEAVAAFFHLAKETAQDDG